jgi:hypothetical protein
MRAKNFSPCKLGFSMFVEETCHIQAQSQPYCRQGTLAIQNCQQTRWWLHIFIKLKNGR